MIRFVCTCGKQLQAREENAGRFVLCPACQQQVTVPDLPSVAIQQEEPIEEAPPRGRVQRDRPNRRDELDDEEVDSRRSAMGSSGKATASLVLGCLSIFCNVLTGLPAIIVGILALRDIGRSQERLTGHGLAIAGIASACLGTLLSCVVGVLPALLLPAVQKVREAASRAQSQNNLKQMVLAMQNYNDTYGSLPPSGVGKPFQPAMPRKPLLSWRVAILPFIEQQNLYNQFKLDEPWDGPNNIKLLAKMPKVYQLPGDDKTPSDRTHYQVFVGNGAAFDKTRGFSIPQDFPDGTSNTILIVTAENAVPWTKPEDVDFDRNKPMLPLMSTYFRNGFQVGMADGSVRTVEPRISETTLKAAITRNGHDPLGPDW
jgi:type II secretory pathway pseudopilin PulG